MPTRHLLRSDDRGFTLVELVTVVATIGVLAAIAVPVFLGQREKAYDSAAQSDLRNVAEQMRLVQAETGTYPNASDVQASGAVTRSSKGVLVSPSWVAATDFCLLATSQDGTLDTGNNGFVDQTMYYTTASSGVHPVTTSDRGCASTRLAGQRPGDGVWSEDGFQAVP